MHHYVILDLSAVTPDVGLYSAENLEVALAEFCIDEGELVRDEAIEQGRRKAEIVVYRLDGEDLILEGKFALYMPC